MIEMQSPFLLLLLMLLAVVVVVEYSPPVPDCRLWRFLIFHKHQPWSLDGLDVCAVLLICIAATVVVVVTRRRFRRPSVVVGSKQR